MASLWALTGSIDPRPVQDARVNDVVHDDSKVGVLYIFYPYKTEQMI